MVSLNGRVERLEQLVRASEPEATPEQRAAEERREQERLECARLARELSATMAPEHIALINAVYGRGPAGRPCEPLADPGARWLAKIAREMIRLARADWWPRWGRRLALPAAVAEAYLAHPGTTEIDGHCLGCGLMVPWRTHGPLEGWGMASGPRLFDACPDCGGALRGPGRSG